MVARVALRSYEVYQHEIEAGHDRAAMWLKRVYEQKVSLFERLLQKIERQPEYAELAAEVRERFDQVKTQL